MKILKRIKNYFHFDKSTLRGSGHTLVFKRAKFFYVYPQLHASYGCFYDHTHPDAEHIDWKKEPYRIQPCECLYFNWLWFHLTIRLHHHYEWQKNEDVKHRNEVKKDAKRELLMEMYN